MQPVQHLKISHQLPIILALIFVGLNLRPPLAVIGPLLLQIKQTIPLSFSLISLLTVLPVLAMGIAMFVATPLVKKIGAFKVVSAALLIIAVSNFFRLYADNLENLLITAVVVGCGIAIIQAVLPSLVKQTFADNVAMYMGVYVTAIMGGAALAASSAVYISQLAHSWQVALACWSVLAVLALIFWIANRAHFDAKPSSTAPKSRSIAFYKLPRAWYLGIFFGLATASYTCVLAWFPPYFIELGWKSAHAGFLLAFLTSVEVLAGLLFPALANRVMDRRWVLLIVTLCMFCGYLGLVLSPTTPALLWAGLLGLGIGGLFPMSLIVSMDHYADSKTSGELTAFVQGIGYLIAASSPLVAGMIRDLSNSFKLSWLILLLITTVLMLMVWAFNPKDYAQKMQLPRN